MPFPIDAAVGSLYTHPANKITYSRTAKGTWKAVSQGDSPIKFSIGLDAPENPDLGDYWHDTKVDQLKIYDYTGQEYRWQVVSNAPVVSNIPPTGPNPGDVWYNIGEQNMYFYVIVEGQGRWMLIASVALSSTQLIMTKIIPLQDTYNIQRYNFEMFTPLKSYNWRSIDPKLVTAASAGDDSLDVANVDGIVAGNTYVLYGPNGVVDTVRVLSLLSNNRIRLYASIGTTITPASKVYLSHTSFNIDTGTNVARVQNGDVFYTRDLDALENWTNGVVALRRDAAGRGSFEVRYRVAGITTWSTAAFMGSESVEGDVYRDEKYSVLGTGIMQLQIRYAENSGQSDTLYHMVFYSAPQSIENSRVEKPYNVTPGVDAYNVSATPTLTGSAYNSLYAIAQGGAEFQIAEDRNFSNIVFNTSTDVLASWVAIAGQTAGFRDAVSTDMNKFVLVGDGGAVLITNDGGKTYSAGTFGDSTALKTITWNRQNLLLAAGAGGIVKYSNNNGGVWTVASLANSYAGTLWGATGNGSTFLVCGDTAEVQRTTNYGTIWYHMVTAGSYAGSWRGITSDANNNVVLVGTLGEIQTSNDFGVNWQKRSQAVAYANTFNAVAMNDDGDVVAVGEGGMVQVSHDYGALWSSITLPGNFTGSLTNVAISGQTVLITGATGKIFTSTNGGDIFFQRPAAGGQTATFTAAVLDKTGYGLIMGAGGIIQRAYKLEGAVGTSYTVPAGADLLSVNKVYWWRVRYQDFVGFWSGYSVPTAFSTSQSFDFVNQPQNLSPANNAQNVSITPLLQAGSFTFIGANDSHAKSQWQVSSLESFATTVYDSGEVTDLTQHTVPANSGLTDSGIYYWRVRYKGASGRMSAYSVPTQFRARAIPTRPAIVVPTSGATGVAVNLTVTGSQFGSTMPGETHSKSQWQFSTNSTFSALVLDTGETDSLLSFQYPKSAPTLVSGTAYYIRVRYRGLNTGWSEWSGGNSFQVNAVGVGTPAVALSGLTDTMVTLNSSAFTVFGLGAEDTHQSTDWLIQKILIDGTGQDVWSLNGATGTQKLQVANLSKSALAAAGQTLTTGETLSVQVRHRGLLYGPGPWSPIATVGKFLWPAGRAEQLFATPGSYIFTVPFNVYAISAAAIGAGADGNASNAGGGGSMAYKNGIPVTPGQTIQVVVGGRGVNGGPSALGNLIIAGGGTGQSGGAPSFNGAGHTGSGFGGGGIGGTYTGGYGGGGGAAGRYGYTGGDGAGYTATSTQVYRPGTSTTTNSWNYKSYAFAGNGTAYSIPSTKTVGSTSTAQSAGATYYVETYVEYAAGGAGGVYEQGENSGVAQFRRYQIYRTTYVLVANTTSTPGYYETITSYATTAPTGTAGAGRGGTSGGTGEGSLLNGSNGVGTYGGGGPANGYGQNGGVRIIWGGSTSPSFPSNAG